MSIKIQVIFYSMYGHVYRMAEAVAEGAKQVLGAEVSLYQVPELTPDDVLEKHGAKAARTTFAKVPVATVDQLAEAHAIISGTPTRFANMSAQMRHFSIKPADFGSAVPSLARSGAFLLLPVRSTVARKPRLRASTPLFCIMAWSS